jgi:uncharacterized protein CbrC (UPF0167 family)
MQNKMIKATMMSLACAAGLATAQGEGAIDSQAIQQRDRDRLLTCTLDQTLPTEVMQAVKDMTQTRDQYQQQTLATCTDEQRNLLRDQLCDQIKDQARDRDQLRDRLKELSSCVESHQGLMDQAREQTRNQVRRCE